MVSHMQWLIMKFQIHQSINPSIHGTLPVSLMLKMFTFSSCDSESTVALGLHLRHQNGENLTFFVHENIWKRRKELDLNIQSEGISKSTETYHWIMVFLQLKIGALQFAAIFGATVESKLSSELSGCLNKLWWGCSSVEEQSMYRFIHLIYNTWSII